MKTITLAAVTLVVGMSFAWAQSATHQSGDSRHTIGTSSPGSMAFTSEHGTMIRQHATGQLSVPSRARFSRTGWGHLAWLRPTSPAS